MNLFQHIGFIVLWIINIVAVFVLGFGPLITRTQTSFQSAIQGVLVFSLAFGVLLPPVLYVKSIYAGKDMPAILRFLTSQGFLDSAVNKLVASPWVWLTPVAFLMVSLVLTAIFYYTLK